MEYSDVKEIVRETATEILGIIDSYSSSELEQLRILDALQTMADRLTTA